MFHQVSLSDSDACCLVSEGVAGSPHGAVNVRQRGKNLPFAWPQTPTPVIDFQRQKGKVSYSTKEGPTPHLWERRQLHLTLGHCQQPEAHIWIKRQRRSSGLLPVQLYENEETFLTHVSLLHSPGVWVSYWARCLCILLLKRTMATMLVLGSAYHVSPTSWWLLLRQECFITALCWRSKKKMTKHQKSPGIPGLTSFCHCMCLSVLSWSLLWNWHPQRMMSPLILTFLVQSNFTEIPSVPQDTTILMKLGYIVLGYLEFINFTSFLDQMKTGTVYRNWLQNRSAL